MSALRKFWLLFAQACTLCVAALFVLTALRPDLLPRLVGRNGNVVLMQETSTPVGSAKVATFADAAKKAMPSVVNIYTTKTVRSRNPLLDDSLLRKFFPDFAERLPQRRTASLGSGVIVAAEGFVLTNDHVIEGADGIEVVLSDGRQLQARVRGTDPESDLAVLKIEGENLPAITLGNPETLQVGDVVLAIGNPFGFGNTVTFGIVSALGRDHLGINSTIFSQSGGSMGIGFAIPVSLARTVLAQIIKDGEVTRGWLGVDPQPITREIAQAMSLQRPEGVLIAGLQPDGPADRAGVHVRDVVVEIAGKPTPDVPKLLARIAELPPGSNAKVRLVRDGKPFEVDVAVARRPRPI